MNRRMSRTLLPLALMVIVLTGCWDRTELNELSITSATAVDRKGDRWVVSYQVLIPSVVSGASGPMKGGAQLPITVYTTEGPTIREAIYQSTLESPRTLFFSHNRVLIVGEELAKGGLSELIDVYLRNSDSRETVTVLIAKGEGRKILEQLLQIQIIPGDGIRETMKTESENYSALPYVNMYSLAKALTSESNSAVIPEIFISGGAPVTSEEQFNSTTMSSKLKLGKLAILRDGRLVGWLKVRDALGVNFIRNQVKKTVISLGCGQQNEATEGPGHSSSMFAVKLLHSATTIKPVLQGGDEPLRMLVKVKAEGTLLETDCKADLDRQDTIKEMERQLEEEIRSVIRNGFGETQKLQTDIVGFADMIHRRYPKRWREMKKAWSQAYAEIKLETQVDFTLRRLGLTSKSFTKLDEESRGGEE
ncbi:Ger(x)C family spore germination protein [Cohnella fermenti]|nr:Ger(x)C family spore germination protein [Cohnella fermenti]